MATKGQGELVLHSGFDYTPLEGKVAERVRSAADRIRQKVLKTLDTLVEIGDDLRAVKDDLPHGEFGKWLKAEFGWSERLAQNFMSVALRFGPKSAIISDLPIAPTAAYLLAAPSVPDEARVTALERAECGQPISVAVAKEIVAEAKKMATKKAKPVAPDKLGLRLLKVLERYKEKWNPKEWGELARQLREFADALEKPQRSGKRKKE